MSLQERGLAGGGRRDIGSLPLDVLAGTSLLGGCRLAQLAVVACVSRRLRDAAVAAAGARRPRLLRLPSRCALPLACLPLSSSVRSPARCADAAWRPLAARHTAV